MILVLLACAGPPAVGDTARQTDPPTDTGAHAGTPPVDTTVTTITTDAGVTASVVVDGVLATVVRVAWSGAERAHVVYGDRRTPEDTSGVVPVLGLTHGETVELALVTPDDTVELGAVTLADPHADLPRWTVTVPNPARSEMAGQHLLLSLLGEGSWAAILDDRGRYVWAHGPGPAPFKITRARWSHDRRAVVFSRYDRSRSTDIGEIVRVDLDGTARTDTRAPLQHHGFVEHADDTYAWLTFEIEDREVDGHGVLPVAGDGVRTGPRSATEDAHSEQRFRFFTDWRHDPWWTCSHFDFDAWIPGAHDWNHTNSIAWEPIGNAWYVMARHNDLLLKLDRQTGAILWEAGGPSSDFAFPDGGFHHAHFSQVLGPDHVLVFDNDLHQGNEARAVEYRFDAATGTAEVLWEQHDPDGDVSGFLGDARRLPGGNTLIAWAPNGRIEEFTPDGERVWMASAPDTVVGRMEPVPDLYAGWR